MGITAQQVNEILLEEVKYKRGFDMDQVDDLLDKIALTLHAYEQDDLSRDIISSQEVVEALARVERTEHQPGYSMEATNALIERALEQLGAYELQRSREYLLEQEQDDQPYTPEIQLSTPIKPIPSPVRHPNPAPESPQPEPQYGYGYVDPDSSPTPEQSESAPASPEASAPAAPTTQAANNETFNPEDFTPKTLVEFFAITESLAGAMEESQTQEFLSLALEYEGTRLGLSDATLEGDKVVFHAGALDGKGASLNALYATLDSFYNYESNKAPLLEVIAVKLEDRVLSVRYAYTDGNTVITVIG